MNSIVSYSEHLVDKTRPFVPFPCNLADDDDFNLPAELAAHICNCQVAVLSINGQTKFFVKKGFANWLGFSPEQLPAYQFPYNPDGLLLIRDLLSFKEVNPRLPIHLPAQIRFVVSLPVETSSGQLIAGLTIMGAEVKTEFPSTQKVALEKISKQIGRLAEAKMHNQQLLEEASNHHLRTAEAHHQELKEIAYKMHEDFAQTLAATKLYLEFAEDHQANNHFLQISKQTIEQVIQKMRTLCTSITPSQAETHLF